MNHLKFVELWNSPKSIKEIAKELQVTENYVSRYAAKHRNECPTRNKNSKAKKSAGNDTKLKEVYTEPGECVAVDSDKAKVKAVSIGTVLIDTSALHDSRTFLILEQANCVILSSVVLREINKLKDKITDVKLKRGFQKVLKDCALDSESKKYLVRKFLRENDECNDETIARCAAEFNNVVVITRDYGLCCYCKLYNVKYLLISPETDSIVQSLIDGFEVESTTFNSEFRARLFFVTRNTGELIITCIKGRIEVQHEAKLTTLLPDDNVRLFEGDKISAKEKEHELHYIVERNKHNKLILRRTSC